MGRYPLFAPSTLSATYRSRQGWRVAGIIVGVAGLVAGVSLVAAAAKDGGDNPLYLGGLGSLLGGATLGLIIGLRDDEATLRVTEGPPLEARERP